MKLIIQTLYQKENLLLKKRFSELNYTINAKNYNRIILQVISFEKTSLKEDGII